MRNLLWPENKKEYHFYCKPIYAEVELVYHKRASEGQFKSWKCNATTFISEAMEWCVIGTEIYQLLCINQMPWWKYENSSVQDQNTCCVYDFGQLKNVHGAKQGQSLEWKVLGIHWFSVWHIVKSKAKTIKLV